MGHSTKHYMDKRSQLEDIKIALRRDTDGARRKLEEDDAWRYHASSMHQVKARAAIGKVEEEASKKELWKKPSGVGRWAYKPPPACSKTENLKFLLGDKQSTR